ncbi:MAG: beta strand repeat-containing protein [Niveispirillum sp.]|uniref:beta strand repeat-containing protein n=1 Tax=Niveispirillum sp. TaxID=1917217 RepID=UPI003BA80568
MARDMHSRRRLLAGTALTGATLILAGTAIANPVDPTVVQGTVGFSSSGSVLEVRQGSDRAIIDWRGFDIAAGETTRFVQPGSGSIALNRVTGGQVSSISGSLTANGRIFLINPNGILFGAGSVVDVAGLVATTADIGNDRFMAGDYRFDSASPVAGATVANAGSINAGMVALIAPQVRNSGTIRAELGRVTLGAAQRFTLDLAGDGLISFDAGSAVDGAKLDQAGLVQGASVLLSAATASQVVDNVIDMTGVIQARSVRQEGGDIVLDGGAGSVAVSGTLNADAAGQGDGGTITVLSDRQVRFTGAISARGAGTGRGGDVELSSKGGLTYRGTTDLTSASGVKGTLLLDPKNIIVAATGGGSLSGNDSFAENPAADATIAAADVVAALNGANLVLQANNDISINAKVDASANAGSGDLTLRAGRSVRLNADVAVKGAFTATANDPAAIAAQRDPGAGSVLVASGVTIASAGRQTYNGDLSLAGNLVTSGAGAISIAGALTVADLATIVTAGGATDGVNVAGASNGSGFLLIDAGAGAVSLASAGATQALSGLAVAGGTVALNGVRTSGRQDIAGALTLNGDLVSTIGGTIRLNGPVTLSGNSTIVTAGFAGDDIQVTGTVNGAYALVADAGAGAVSLSGAVGGSRALTLLSAGGSSVRVGSVTTSGQQDYAGAITLAGDLVSTVGGSIRLGGPVTLTGNSSIVTAGFAGNDVRVTGAIDGAYALVADAGAGAVSLSGPVGGSRALTLLSAGGSSVRVGSVITRGQQDYAGAITLAGDLVSTVGGSIRLGGPVTLTGNSSIVTAGFAGDDVRLQGKVDGAYSLIADAGRGQVVVDGAVGASRALTLFAAGGASVKLADVTTSGRQDYAGAVTLAGNLVSNAGGAIRLAGPVTLATNSAIVTAGFAGDDITIAGTVDGARSLVLDAGAGRIGVTGPVGAGRALTSFAAGAASVAVRDVTTRGQQDYAGAVTLAGNLVSTVGGAIRVGGPLTLTGDSAIVSAGFSGDDIRLTGAVNGPYALLVDAGAGRTVLDAAVGASNALKLLSVAGAGVSVRAVRTTGQQDYAGAITLNGDLASSAGGTIRLAGPVTLAANSTITSAGSASDGVAITGAVAGPYRMNIRAGSGTVGLGGPVNGLSALDVTGGAVTLASPVSVTDALIANGTRLTLGALAGATVTLNGSEALTTGAITASQDVRVSAGKGATLGTVSARNLTVTAGDALSLGNVTTSQDATVTGARAVTLGTVSSRTLIANAATDLRLAGVTGDSAQLTAGNRIAATGTLSLTRGLVLETAGTATGLDVRAGSLTYRGAGQFAASGTVGGIAGTGAADLVQVAGSRSGTYLFADRPVFGVAALVDRQRLDIPLVDTLSGVQGDVRTAPLVLDPALVKDELISFQD